MAAWIGLTQISLIHSFGPTPKTPFGANIVYVSSMVPEICRVVQKMAQFFVERLNFVKPIFKILSLCLWRRKPCSINQSINHPPPRQLPAEFYNYVTVLEIIDSHIPGYVYLKLRYFLAYCPEDEKYNYLEIDQEVYRHCDNNTRKQFLPHRNRIANVWNSLPAADTHFYRAMHFSAKRGIAIACRLSVRLSVCDVGEL